MDAADERERRQLRLMEDRLTSFDHGELDLGKTIAELRGLLAALELTSNDLVEGPVHHEWSELELAYAAALNNNDPIPDATNPILDQASRRMLDLVRERLAED